MKSKILIPCLVSVLLLFGLSVPGMTQQHTSTATPPVDSVDIAIPYTTVYPGTDTAWLEVWMDNNEYYVGGFQFMFTLSSDVVGFCEDDSGGCIIDTTGGVAGQLGMLGCGYGGVWAEVWGNAAPPGGHFIEPYPGYRLLFRLCMYACCVGDTTNDRVASIYMTPGGNSFIVDENGEPVPFRYHQGDLTLWWSVPGDASGDSLVTVADAVFLVNYLYRQGSEPCICEAADANGDCLINLGDLVYVLGYLFRDGPDPLPGCAHCWLEECWAE
jgi:hypothetical protein